MSAAAAAAAPPAAEADVEEKERTTELTREVKEEKEDEEEAEAEDEEEEVVVTVKADPDQQQQQHPPVASVIDPVAIQPAKVFVGGIAWNTTEECVRSAFERYGRVTGVAIMRDHATGRSRGFGFVTFDSALAAERALEANDRSEVVVDGRTIEVKRAVPRSAVGSDPAAAPSPRELQLRQQLQQRQQSVLQRRQQAAQPEVPLGADTGSPYPFRKVFVGSLPRISDRELRDAFAKFGPVVDAQVLVDKNTGRHRGFGFVTFENAITAASLLGQQVFVCGRKVEVRRADPIGPNSSTQQSPLPLPPQYPIQQQQPMMGYYPPPAPEPLQQMVMLPTGPQPQPQQQFVYVPAEFYNPLETAPQYQPAPGQAYMQAPPQLQPPAVEYVYASAATPQQQFLQQPSPAIYARPSYAGVRGGDAGAHRARALAAPYPVPSQQLQPYPAEYLVYEQQQAPVPPQVVQPQPPQFAYYQTQPQQGQQQQQYHPQPPPPPAGSGY